MTQSSFGALNAAYSGLSAAQMGIDIVGQNIDNATTTGYVRERVEQQGVGAPAPAGPIVAPQATSGQGVAITSIDQLSSNLLDAQVRTTSAAAGYSQVRSTALTQIETALGEPADNALSGQLQTFWAAWQDVSNQPGDAAPVGTLLGQANALTNQISTAYQAVQQQWSQTNTDVATKVAQLNSDAAQVAAMNGQIRSIVASGGNANELIDQRTNVAADIATLAGGSVTQNSDGTISINVGGTNIVDGTNSRAVKETGATQLEGAASSPVQLVWADSPTSGTLSLNGGEIAGDISLLAPADGTGTGGPLAETAAQLNTLATSLATQVNTVSETGVTSSGATGQDFFALAAGVPAALGLSVVPTNVSGVAVAAVGAGAADGSIADAISQIGTASNSPDSAWASYVVQLGAQSQVESQQASLSQSAQNAATTAQASQESVDLDEENMNLIAYQHAYEGAARVMTTLDQMLDQLINHTGVVGLE
jgi:flagellar hook-associated protein 1